MRKAEGEPSDRVAARREACPERRRGKPARDWTAGADDRWGSGGGTWREYSTKLTICVAPQAKACGYNGEIGMDCAWILTAGAPTARPAD